MSIEINSLLELMCNKKGSDLHISVGKPPVIRVSKRLRELNLPKLTPEDTTNLMKSICSDRVQQELNEVGGSDFGFAYKDKARFRVSVFKQKGTIGLVLRQIPSKLLAFEDIGLPMMVKNLIVRPRGMMLVTGPTGSGKTTTLAAMINFINEEHDHHIITIEDPIEYYHPHKKSVVTQREIGTDVKTFSEALRRALRQDPDVILVGEMRDLETIESAVTAAETGHLVFGTLHTTGAARTIDRIVDVFPTIQQEQIRAQLAGTMVAVISQALCQKASKDGVVAAFEIMVVNSAIQNLIREGKTFRIDSAIQTGRSQGMILLDDFLFDLYVNKIITHHEAMSKCQNLNDLQQKIKEYTDGLAAKQAAANAGGKTQARSAPPQ